MEQTTFLRVKDKKELKKRQIITITQTYLEVTRQERKLIILNYNQLNIIGTNREFTEGSRCKIHQIITLP